MYPTIRLPISHSAQIRRNLHSSDSSIWWASVYHLVQARNRGISLAEGPWDTRSCFPCPRAWIRSPFVRTWFSCCSTQSSSNVLNWNRIPSPRPWATGVCGIRAIGNVHSAKPPGRNTFTPIYWIFRVIFVAIDNGLSISF